MTKPSDFSTAHVDAASSAPTGLSPMHRIGFFLRRHWLAILLCIAFGFYSAAYLELRLSRHLIHHEIPEGNHFIAASFYRGNPSGLFYRFNFTPADPEAFDQKMNLYYRYGVLAVWEEWFWNGLEWIRRQVS